MRLLGAKITRRIDGARGFLDIGDDDKTMTCLAKAVASIGLHRDLVRTGTEIVNPLGGYRDVTRALLDLQGGGAFTIGIGLNDHAPTTDTCCP